MVSSLPPSCTLVYSGGQTYSDCGGAFYSQTGEGYKVVTPPAGLIVNSLPSGAVTKNAGGTPYLEFGGVWYRPFYSGSDVVYQVVDKPGG